MESAFAWLGSVMEWLGSFVPRIKIVRSTHAGVKFKHGKHPQPIGPGIHIYWPIVTEMDIIPVARQTHNLPTQSLLTKDGRQVVVGGVVVYAITDILSTLSKNWDIADTINDITLLAISDVVTSHELDYLHSNLNDAVQKALTKATRKQLRQYGVKVYRTALTDFSTCMVIKNIGGQGGPILPQYE